ncbi:MAG: hypothetical protein KY464_18150 [Gemmatimonadetes bacterium]|nr:hypothetical protein [Gemmatimonadota bacterium]
MRQERADELLPVLDEFGVNHLDVAASYGDAELRLAPWLAGRRDDFFLATKTGERTGAAARAEISCASTRPVTVTSNNAINIVLIVSWPQDCETRTTRSSTAILSWYMDDRSMGRSALPGSASRAARASRIAASMRRRFSSTMRTVCGERCSLRVFSTASRSAAVRRYPASACRKAARAAGRGRAGDAAPKGTDSTRAIGARVGSAFGARDRETIIVSADERAINTRAAAASPCRIPHSAARRRGPSSRVSARTPAQISGGGTTSTSRVATV